MSLIVNVHACTPTAERSDSVGTCRARLGVEGLLVRDSPESLDCVVEKDTLFAT